MHESDGNFADALRQDLAASQQGRHLGSVTNRTSGTMVFVCSILAQSTFLVQQHKAFMHVWAI